MAPSASHRISTSATIMIVIPVRIIQVCEKALAGEIVETSPNRSGSAVLGPLPAFSTIGDTRAIFITRHCESRVPDVTESMLCGTHLMSVEIPMARP